MPAAWERLYWIPSQFRRDGAERNGASQSRHCDAAGAAAQLVLKLLDQIDVFEKTFGQIRHPRWKAFREGVLDVDAGVKPHQGPPAAEVLTGPSPH